MKIKRVVGIDPKSPGHHIYSAVAIPRLGLPILGTILNKLGIEVRIFLEDFSRIDWSEVQKADLAMLSSITATTPRAYEFAERIRKMGIPVVIGGSHVSFLPNEALNHTDYVILGEGEKAIVELIEALEGKRLFSKVSNLSYQDKVDNNIANPILLPIENLDEIPDPDFNLIANWHRQRVVPLETSRGCPHSCEFCSVTKMFGHKLRYHSPERVIKQIHLLALNPETKAIFFSDDNFTANCVRTKILLEKMITDLDRIPPWSAQVCVSAADDEELLRLMKEANCTMVFVGIESINPETLKEYGKKQTVQDSRRFIRRFHGFGIKVHGMFVLGGDHDTVPDIRKTLRFAKDLGIDTVQFLNLTPVPGTPLFKKFEVEGRIFEKKWDFYDGHHVVFHPVQMSAYALQKETIRAMRRFYSKYQVAKQWFLLILRLRQLIQVIKKPELRPQFFGNLYLRKIGYQTVRGWLRDIRNINFLRKLHALSRLHRKS